VLPGLDPVAAGLEPVQGDTGVRDEVGEDPEGIRAAADAGGDGVGEPAVAVQELGPASVLITRWNSRTSSGNGCGPATVPIR
jgi:hypothetical protein